MKHIVIFPRLIVLAILGSFVAYTAKKAKKQLGFSPADYDFLHQHGMKIDG